MPAGWTSPACGAAKTATSGAATNSTNQPGTVVAGWVCTVSTVGGHQVLHWTGPQVVAPATLNDSAQFFQLTVTTPSPAAQTTYNGTGSTEGFIVDQAYASGLIEHWMPNAAFPGTVPPGATSTVATGLVRTVAGPLVTTTTSTTVAPTTTTTTRPTTTTTVCRNHSHHGRDGGGRDDRNFAEDHGDDHHDGDWDRCRPGYEHMTQEEADQFDCCVQVLLLGNDE